MLNNAVPSAAAVVAELVSELAVLAVVELVPRSVLAVVAMCNLAPGVPALQ